MPLSEQEQRLLDEMERSLYHSEADVVSTIGAHRGRPNYTAVVIGILIALLGVGTIVTGVITRLPIIGVVGFVVMFAGVLLAISRPRHASPRSGAAPAASPAPHSKGASFMDRLNERWDRRQDGRER